MNKQEQQAKQQERQEQRIKALTLEAGAEMIETVLPTMQGGNWDNYSLPEKVYLIYFCAEHKAKEFIRNGGRFAGEKPKPAKRTPEIKTEIEKIRRRFGTSKHYLPEPKGGN